MTAEPEIYSVILLNDDLTPMEFVVDLLQEHFGLNRDEAIQRMLNIHHDGSGECGRFPREIADQKVAKIAALALEKNHPLRCFSEPAQQ
jgi:ATP-dependent Clp protease adaptor protein ClpS